MDYKKQVLNALKPKVKAFGFSKDELESVAAQIADNLNLADEASEDEIQTAITTAVDGAVPFLKLTQSAVSRIVNAQRSQHREDEDDDPSKTPPTKPQPTKTEDEVPAWAKQLIESNTALKAEITAMKSEKTATSRKAQLEAVVQNAGSYAKTVLRQFERMKFDTDEEFDNYLSEVKEDLESYNQERIDAGLQGLGNPPSAQGSKGKETEVFTEAELDAVADQF